MFINLVCSTIKILHDLSSDRRESDWFLSLIVSSMPSVSQIEITAGNYFLLLGKPKVQREDTSRLIEEASTRAQKAKTLQLWDTSGQGRFCTIIRSYSRGAQGIFLVYDITNKWSFDGIDRWLKEVEEHAPGVPKVLVGNRLHLAFKRQVGERDAEAYAAKNHMAFLKFRLFVI